MKAASGPTSGPGATAVRSACTSTWSTGAGRCLDIAEATDCRAAPSRFEELVPVRPPRPPRTEDEDEAEDDEGEDGEAADDGWTAATVGKADATRARPASDSAP